MSIASGASACSRAGKGEALLLESGGGDGGNGSASCAVIGPAACSVGDATTDAGAVGIAASVGVCPPLIKSNIDGCGGGAGGGGGGCEGAIRSAGTEPGAQPFNASEQ